MTVSTLLPRRIASTRRPPVSKKILDAQSAPANPGT
jgi:hypothetical protein